MKKLYAFLLCMLALQSQTGSAQQAYLFAPNGTATSSLRAPNGNSVHATFRGCYLIRASELSLIAGITQLNAFGFRVTTGAGTAVTGSIQVYFENTSDLTFQKSTTWSTAIAPMTSVYNSTMTVPATGNQTITLTFPTNFTYTGGGLYVAYDWIANGPFANGQAVYAADNSLVNPGGMVATSAPPAGTLLTIGPTRPNFRIGYINTYTNEAQVHGLLGYGKIPLLNGTPYTFSVLVKNNAAVTMSNVVSTLSITGANPDVLTTTISSIPAYGSVTATFPPYTPTTQGISTVQVSVPPDENNANNNAMITQSTTCNHLGYAPPVPIASFSQGVGFNTSAGIIVQRIRVPVTSTLNAVRLGIPNVNANINNSIYGVITNNTGSILATTATMNISAAMLSTFQNFTFATPVSIAPNIDYHIGLAQPANSVTGYFPLATMPTPSNNIPFNLYSTSNITGGFLGSLTPTLGYFAIEGIFDAGVNLTLTPLTSTICSGNSATLNASGASTYSWSNGANTASNVVSPNMLTVYTATGSAIVGTVGTCSDVKTTTVYVNITPTISVNDGIICPVGGSHTFVPTGAATYTISGGSATVSPSVTTQYTITGTSGAGCPAANPAIGTVSVSNGPTVAISGNTFICRGDSVTLNASGALSYTWSNAVSDVSVSVSPTVTGNYSVVGAFGNCTASAVHNISVTPVPVLTITSTSSLLCIGQTAVLSGIGAQTFSWSTGSNTYSTVISPSVTTVYTLTGTNASVCVGTGTIQQNVISCIGLEELAGNRHQLSIYPNPSQGLCQVQATNIGEGCSIEVSNALGQIVHSQKAEPGGTELNLQQLPKGVYLLRLQKNAKTLNTARLLIQ